MFNVYRLTVEVIAVGSKHVVFNAVLRHSIDRQDDLIGPLFDWHLDLHPLAGPVSPSDEPSAVLRFEIANNFVRQTDIEVQRARFGIDFRRDVENVQTCHEFLCIRLRLNQ